MNGDGYSRGLLSVAPLANLPLTVFSQTSDEAEVEVEVATTRYANPLTIDTPPFH